MQMNGEWSGYIVTAKNGDRTFNIDVTEGMRGKVPVNVFVEGSTWRVDYNGRNIPIKSASEKIV